MAKPIIVKRSKNTAERYRYQYALVQPRGIGFWLPWGVGAFALFALSLALFWSFSDNSNPPPPVEEATPFDTPTTLLTNTGTTQAPDALATATSVWTETDRITPALEQPLPIVMSPLQDADEVDALEQTLNQQGELRTEASAIVPEALVVPQISFLLQQAQQQLKALRLTRPDGDNAYATYEQLRACSADPSLAAALLNAIAERYAGLINDTINEEQLSKSKRLMANLTKLHPEYDQDWIQQNLLDKTFSLLDKQAVIPYGMRHLKFLQTWEGLPAKQLDKAQRLVLSKLEQRAKAQLERKRYTMPGGNNAKHSYQLMLELDGKNRFAQKGLKNLSRKYADLTKKAMDQGAYSRARQMLRRGLAVDPKDKRLLALKKQLKGGGSKKTLSATAYEDRIIAAVEAGNIDQSLSLLKQGLKKYPNHQGLLDLKQAIEKGLGQ